MDENNSSESKNQTEDTTILAREATETKNIDLSDKPSPKPKKTKKLVIFFVIVTLLLVAGAAAWKLTQNKAKPNTGDTAQSEGELAAKPTNETSKLFGVAYSYGDAEKVGMELFWRPIAGGDRRSAKNIGQKNYVTSSGVYQNQVFVETSPGSGSSEGVTLWYSSDSGKTYENILELDLPKPDEAGQQITSVIFSKDGSKLAFGYLPEAGKTNIIKEIDLKTKQTTDLFTVKTAGVFLVGYDSEKKQIYYYPGCYNCDGNTRSELNVVDLSTKTESNLYDTPDKIGMTSVISNDYTKLLIVDGVQGDGLGGGEPYTIKEFDIATKTFKELLVIDKGKTYPQIGYRDSENTPYYTDGNGVYGLANDGVKTLLFEASKPIVSVYYVGKDQVVASSGTFEDFALTSYTISSKAVVEILKGDQSTSLFGVTWQ